MPQIAEEKPRWLRTERRACYSLDALRFQDDQG